jgi:Zn-dependent M28 family amino/carboxypeptidase
MRHRLTFTRVTVIAVAFFALTGFTPWPTRASAENDVAALASNTLQGRDNNTPGSVLAQDYLIGQLRQFATGIGSTSSGDDAFRQPIPSGTNIVAMIPGGELPNEYVVVGAHYDHLGHNCRTQIPSDTICNGATDNAAGVANVLAIGRALAQSKKPPRRSVILALWDREEDGLVGSAYYVQHPLRPLSETVAYVNYDIQGSNVLPSLRRDTFAVGAETGGPDLQAIVARAGHRGGLHLDMVSSIFGEARSDYVNFIGAGVPTVFFSDTTGPCYHTAQDDVGVVDFQKLHKQAAIGTELVRTILRDGRIGFVGNAPLATYADAVTLAPVTQRGLEDLGRFSPSDQTQLLKFHDDVHAMVAAGPAKFDSNAVSTLLSDAAVVVNILNTGPCDGFLSGH